MLDFMVIALPRSATTWVSNFLTTDSTLCLHDPLYNWHYGDLDRIAQVMKTSGKPPPPGWVGISCTGIWRFPDFVKAHPARKLVIHRNLNEINDELSRLGLPLLTGNDYHALSAIDGFHVDFEDLFEAGTFELIQTYLTGLPFNRARFNLLTQIEMQPKFSGLTINKEVTRRLHREVLEAIGMEYIINFKDGINPDHQQAWERQPGGPSIGNPGVGRAPEKRQSVQLQGDGFDFKPGRDLQ
jgi:hypothetical protein